MTVRNCATIDRRNLSREIVRLDCEFTCEGATHQAVLVDLSPKGAFFSADSLPPNGSIITVRLNSPFTDKPLVFSGKVVRGTWVMSDHGKRSRFGITLAYPPVGLIRLMSAEKPKIS